MKHSLLLFALLFAFGATAQTVEKQTFIYSIKEADTLRLDRYRVAADVVAPKPCLMFVFGGGFVGGERDNSRYVPYFEYYAQRGYDVVSIDYRLGLKRAMQSGALGSTEGFQRAWLATLAMAVEDLYDATAYVLACAEAWGVDRQAIVASGSSAGAITALMGEYGICNGSALARNLPKNFNYAGVISYAGAIFAMDEELEWRQAPAPLMLFHGDADRNVPYDVIRDFGAGFFGSKYIAQQLTDKRAPHWFYSVANTDHSIAVSPMDNNRYEIDAFLEKFVAEKQSLIIDTHVTPLDKPEVKKEFSLMDYVQSNFSE